MADINDYVGIPWILGGREKSGADCWGLAVMVLGDVFGVIINRFDGDKSSGDDLVRIIESETSGPDWVLTESPSDGDVCIMKTLGNGRPEHIGVYVGGMIIHALGINQQGSSAIHRPKALAKIFKKLEYYTFVGNDNNSQ